MTDAPPPSEARRARPDAPPVVVGWVAVGAFDRQQRVAVKRARALVRRHLARELPAFAWAAPLVRHENAGAAARRAEPVELLDLGVAEMERAGWDFALVVTASDLHARLRPHAFATPSDALNTGVLSLARLGADLHAAPDDDEEAAADRADHLARRLAALALHTFGHLNGLGHRPEPDAFMHAPRTAADLDAMTRFTEPGATELAAEVADVADERLEEMHAFRAIGDAAFALRALWHGRADVRDAVLQIRPWRFPLQLSRLTTAAASTLLVLVFTAEAWDVGMRQSPGVVAGLSVVVLAATTAYLAQKQRLVARRHGTGRTEQRVVTTASVLLGLVLGMATTYALLFGTVLALGALLFDADILAGWAANLGAPVTPARVATFAGFVAAVGLTVGALGGSFEEPTAFRHAAYVDEET